MPTFRSPHNPEFKLSSHRLPRTIVFTNGRYATEDPDEVRALRRCESVEEVEELEVPGATAPAPIVLETSEATEVNSETRQRFSSFFNPNDPLGS